MKNYFLFLVLPFLMFMGCNDDGDPTPEPQPRSKYVVLTTDLLGGGTYPGYFTVYETLPSGTIDNISATQSLQTQWATGIVPYKGWIFRQNSTSGDVGLQKYTVSADNKLQDAGFIAFGNTYGNGNFVIESDTKGYYWDMDRGLAKIQVFNPTTMARTGEIDLSSLVDPAEEYQAIGQHLLAVKEGRLYASIHYGAASAMPGVFDDQYNKVSLAVINTSTDAYEKTIEYTGTKGTGLIGLAENNSFTIGDDGHLYICTPALSFTGAENSKIVRIRSGQTDFDTSWSVNVDDYTSGATFTSVFVTDGNLYTQISNEAVAPGLANLYGNTYDYYQIPLDDPASGQPIAGIPTAMLSPAQAIVKVDGNVYFTAIGADVNAYYQLTGPQQATEAFRVSAGGLVQGFTVLTD